MARLRPQFTRESVEKHLNSVSSDIESKTLAALQYAGEEFVSKARTTQTYQDQTGNLRSSIGYVILKDGKVLSQNMSGTNQGRQNASQATMEVGARYPKGMVLIGVAGMNYAAAVESKGYDVITGSAPESNELKELLSAIKF